MYINALKSSDDSVLMSNKYYAEFKNKYMSLLDPEVVKNSLKIYELSDDNDDSDEKYAIFTLDLSDMKFRGLLEWKANIARSFLFNRSVLDPLTDIGMVKYDYQKLFNKLNDNNMYDDDMTNELEPSLMIDSLEDMMIDNNVVFAKSKYYLDIYENKLSSEVNPVISELINSGEVYDKIVPMSLCGFSGFNEFLDNLMKIKNDDIYSDDMSDYDEVNDRYNHSVYGTYIEELYNSDSEFETDVDLLNQVFTYLYDAFTMNRSVYESCSVIVGFLKVK